MAIIKCSECNKDISDKAATCPYCGVSIKLILEENNRAEEETVVDSVSSEPVSETSVISEPVVTESVVPDTPVTVSDSISAAPANPVPSAVPVTNVVENIVVQEPPVKKKSKKKLIIISSILVVLIAAVIVGLYLYSHRGNYVQTLVAEEEMLYLGFEEEANVSYEVYPKYTDYEIEYSSDDEKIATVDDDGTITGVGEGTTTITIKAPNGKKDTVEVCVSELYSNWDFYCTFDSSNNQMYTSSDCIAAGVKQPTIKFEEDRFELFFYNDTFTGHWKKSNKSSDDSVFFEMTLDDGGTLPASIADINGTRTLLLLVTSTNSINFQLDN